MNINREYHRTIWGVDIFICIRNSIIVQIGYAGLCSLSIKNKNTA